MLSGRVSAIKKKGPGRPRKLSLEQEQQLADWVDNSPDVTLKQLKSKLLEELKVSASSATIGRALRHMSFVLKELRLVPIARNSPENLAARKVWVENMMANRPLNQVNIISTDEIGYHLHIR